MFFIGGGFTAPGLVYKDEVRLFAYYDEHQRLLAQWQVIGIGL